MLLNVPRVDIVMLHVLFDHMNTRFESCYSRKQKKCTADKELFSSNFYLQKILQLYLNLNVGFFASAVFRKHCETFSFVYIPVNSFLYDLLLLIYRCHNYYCFFFCLFILYNIFSTGVLSDTVLTVWTHTKPATLQWM